MALVNLENLPRPKIIEELSFDTIFNAILTDFRARANEYNSIVESDPVYSLIQAVAYREVDIRKRINDAIRAVLIAFATGSDLDHLAAAFGTFRQIITAADLTTTPVTEAVVETDTHLRERALSVFETISPGSQDWYERLAINVDSNIREVQAVRTTPGNITVYVQSEDNNGLADSDLITKVRTVVEREASRFFGDTVTVSAATQISYTITATLTISNSALATEIANEVTEQVEAFCNSSRRFSMDIPLSAIYAQLNQEYVTAADLTSPTANVTVSDGQIPVCAGVNITTS